jgi:hypothetical protein
MNDSDAGAVVRRSPATALLSAATNACAAGDSERPRLVMIPIRRFITGA